MTRLLCASRWTPDVSAVSGMLASRAAWLRRTELTGVRTGLLHASGWLVRWHEGSEEAVAAEWARLGAEPNVHGLRVLHRSQGPRTLPAGVQFASLHASEAQEDVARRIATLVRERRQAGEAEPAEVWQALAAPCLLAHPGSVGFVGRRDVLILASEDDTATEVVRLLALAGNQRFAYQRFAGSDLERGDLGAAYLDLPTERTVVTRVQALPRRSLVDSAALLGMRDVHGVVLLLGSHDLRAQALLAEVAQLLRVLPRPPAIVVAGRSPITRDAALEALAPLEAGHVVAMEATPGNREAAALVWRLVQSGGAP